MKFINLVLFSKSPDNFNHYEKMKEELETYYKTFPNVFTLFYTAKEDLEIDYKIENGFLYIKSEDTFNPGILKKTIKAFQYTFDNILTNDIDYVIRSNVSTIINFKLLEEELIRRPIKVYGGGRNMNLQWLDKKSGIEDYTWFGTIFAAGTCIILSKFGLDFILKYKDKIRYDIIDDVSIALLFREYLHILPQEIGMHRYLEVPRVINKNNDDNVKMIDSDIIMIFRTFVKNNFIFYRNNRYESNEERYIDVEQMKLIINILMKNI